MKIPRRVALVALLSSTALLFGCSKAGSASSASNGLAVTTTALPDATVSQAYSGILQASGGAAPYSWNVTSGVLPTSLNLSTSGQIAGTPTAVGNYTFQVQVTDSSKHSSSSQISLKVTGPGPIVYSISPTLGSTGGGTPVTISGKNLQSGATVAFGGVDGTSVIVVSSSEMTALTPPHAAGVVDVVVTNPGGKSATLSAGFGYGSAPPSISAISPNNGPIAGGTTVNITGSNFAAGALVFFGAIAATGVTIAGPTQIQAVTPSVSAAAAVNVVVQDPDGQSANLTDGFTYTSPPSNSPPTVSSVSPSTAASGSVVNVNGTNFAYGATVTFNSTGASKVQFLNSSQLAVTLPGLSAGTYDVTVGNTNGLSASLPSSLTVADPQSLLTGCTVETNNQPSCSIPAGWTLVASEGFEGGVLHNTANASICGGCTITTTNPHSGSYSLQSTINNDDTSTRWDYEGVHWTTDVYVSWWEYQQANGLTPGQSYGGCPDEPSLTAHQQNDENMLGYFKVTFPDGGIQEYYMDRFPQAEPYADPTCTYNGTPLGLNQDHSQIMLGRSATEAGGVTPYEVGSGITAKGQEWGHWNQWEMWFHPNTPNQSNGFVRVFLNGTLIGDWEKQNLNGSLNMTQGATLINVDAVYTRFVWETSPGNYCFTWGCAGEKVRCSSGFSVSACPPIGSPVFKRWVDDIVVMER